MYFQTSPILPQLSGASGLGFAFDHTPYVRGLAKNGAYPFLLGKNVVAQHSGVRRTNATTGRMGGQRRTTWLAGVGDASSTPSTQMISQEDAAAVAASTAQIGFVTGAAVAVIPAAVVGLVVGYLIWGGQ